MEKPRDWDKIKEIVGAALEKEPHERSTFLEAACAQDPELLSEVESLVAAHEQADELSEHPWISQLSTAAQTDVIGPYKLLRRLGEGGMGQVWLADQTAPLHRQVALKLIRGGMFDSSALQRFQSERQSLAMMDHPSIAKVFDAGATPDGQPYLVMEYVPGVPITDYCDQKRLKIADRLNLFVTVCEAVQHAHQKAIIHRDLKPANILVQELDGKPVPRIIDFGLAKAIGPRSADESLHTRLGGFVGTPGYISPEQCGGGSELDVDTRTDVYSLGVVAYILLTGCLPFQPQQGKHQPLDEMLRLVREEDPPSPSSKVSAGRETSSASAEARGTEPKQLLSQLRGDLDWIVMKALEKDRSRRYGAASELAAEFQRYLNHEPVLARPASISYRVSKYVRRHRAAVSAAAAVVILLAAFSVMQAVQVRRVTRERDRANRITDFMTAMFKVSDPSEARGNSITAREILDKTSHEIATSLTNDPESQAQMMFVMGNVYRNLGLYPKAQTLFTQASNIQHRVLGPYRPETLSSQSHIGAALYDQGHYPEAEKLLRDTLAIQRRVLGPEHPETLFTMSNLSSAVEQQNRLSEAELLDRQVLEASRRVLGPDHRQTLRSMDGLVFCVMAQGRFSEAESLQRESLSDERRALGPDDPDTVFSMNRLARILSLEKRYPEAESIQRDALALQRRILGNDHPDTMRSKMNLVDILGKEEHYAEAEPLWIEIRDFRQRTLGRDNPSTAVANLAVAELEALQGHREQAFAPLREAVDHGLPAKYTVGIADEETLISLHGDPRFAAIVARIKAQTAAQKPK